MGTTVGSWEVDDARQRPEDGGTALLGLGKSLKLKPYFGPTVTEQDFTASEQLEKPSEIMSQPTTDLGSVLQKVSDIAGESVETDFSGHFEDWMDEGFGGKLYDVGKGIGETALNYGVKMPASFMFSMLPEMAYVAYEKAFSERNSEELLSSAKAMGEQAIKELPFGLGEWTPESATAKAADELISSAFDLVLTPFKGAGNALGEYAPVTGYMFNKIAEIAVSGKVIHSAMGTVRGIAKDIAAGRKVKAEALERLAKEVEADELAALNKAFSEAATEVSSLQAQGKPAPDFYLRELSRREAVYQKHESNISPFINEMRRDQGVTEFIKQVMPKESYTSPDWNLGLGKVVEDLFLDKAKRERSLKITPKQEPSGLLKPQEKMGEAYLPEPLVTEKPQVIPEAAQKLMDLTKRPKLKSDYGMTPEEIKITNDINRFNESKGLPKIVRYDKRAHDEFLQRKATDAVNDFRAAKGLRPFILEGEVRIPKTSMEAIEQGVKASSADMIKVERRIDSLDKVLERTTDLMEKNALATERGLLNEVMKANEGNFPEFVKGRLSPEAQEILKLKAEGKKTEATLSNLLKGERGSFSNKKLSPEEIAALDKLVERARQKGRELFDVLVEGGMAPRVAENVVKYAKESTAGASNSIFLNGSEPAMIKRSRKGKPQKARVATKADFEQLRKIPKLRDRLLEGSLTPSYYIFREAGPWLRERLYAPYKKAMINVNKEMAEAANFANAWAGKVGRAAREELGKHWISQELFGKEILEAMGIDVKNIKPITDPIMLAMRSEIEARFKTMLDRINVMRKNIGLPQIKGIENYLTFFAEEGLLTQAMNDFQRGTLGKSIKRAFGKGESRFKKVNDLVNDSLDSIKYRHDKSVVKATVFRHLKRKGNKGLDIRLDPLEIYMQYASNGIRHIHVSPVLRTIHEFTRLYENPKTGKFTSLKNRNPNLDEFLKFWGNNIAGIPNVTLPRKFERVVSAVNRNLTMAQLYWNFKTALLVQPTAIATAYVELGVGPMVRGIMDMAIERSAPVEKSLVLPTRVHDAAWQNTLGMIRFGKVGQALKKVDELGGKPMSAVDYYVAETAWRSAFLKASKTMKEQDAINFADDFVTRTQGSGAVGDISPIQANALGKMATLWQTFSINHFNWVTEDVLGYKNSKVSKGEAVARTFRYVSALSIMGYLFEDLLHTTSPAPDPVRAVLESASAFGEGEYEEGALNLMQETGEFLPFGGGFRYGSNPAGPVVDLLGQVSRRASGDPMARPMWESAGKLAGVRGLGQVMKYQRARERGEEVLPSLIGSYREPAGKKKKNLVKKNLKKN